MVIYENDSPRCYFAVYADPDLPGHVSIEGGRFGNRAMPKNMGVGDMVLLYCTSSYPGHSNSVPGIGLVTAVNHVVKGFWYDYVAFEQAIPLEFIRFAMTKDDQARLANMWHDFLFQISRASFRTVTQSAKLRGRSP